MTDDINNWYKKIPKRFIPKYDNPCYNSHLMKIPFRACIIGGSGSGKTQLVLEILSRMHNTFGLVILCCKSSDEPLYNYLKSKLPPETLHIYENGDIPDLKEYKDVDTQMLFIADDLVNDKKAEPKLNEWWLRGRKLGKGCCMCYLTQSYFKTPKFIRINCNYFFLKKLSSMRDLNMILKDHDLGLKKDVLFDMYEYCVKNHGSLVIDSDAEPECRFRRNFLEILNPTEYGKKKIPKYDNK